jgi:hypothetical protein
MSFYMIFIIVLSGILFKKGKQMRKLFTKGLCYLMMFVLVGCTTDQDSLSSKQQKAVNNSIAYIKNSSFSSKDRINTKVISISLATESTWKSTLDKDSVVDESTIDSTDWVITIGESSGHDFAIIVCDSESSKVIGYKPID